MKVWLSIVLMLTLTGCAKRVLAPAVHLVVPRTCITDLRFTQSSVCRPRQDGNYACDGVVLRAACTKVVFLPKKPAGSSPTQP